MHSFLRISAFVVGAAFAVPAAAEGIIFKCFFDWKCDPNRKCDHDGVDIRYKVDLETEVAERIGMKSDLIELEMIFGDRAITIMEKPISGGITTTTLLIDNGDAVRSENEISGRDLAPMQYLGQCISM
ncbi:hypothetical protein [uncultured Shimia sp.]|uniref:hypothetical protein n=1 Tax=uncultured Shimia sp. TaxID=573152 RepID=UPI002626D261|nr:hypothetical protein [uncultured Shimia sp.]